MNIEIISIVNIWNYSSREQQLLPHYIKHYKNKLGVKIIIACDYNNVDLHNFCDKNEIKYHVFTMDKEIKQPAHSDCERMNEIKDIYKSWYIPTDLDEFIDFQSKEHINDLIKSCSDNKKKYISGRFRDRFIEEKKIKKNIDLNIPIEEQFPFKCQFTANVVKGYCRKVCLCSPDCDTWPGHHEVANDSDKLLENKDFILNVDHYKWFGDVLEFEKQKLLNRIKHKNDFTEEQIRILKFFGKDV